HRGWACRKSATQLVLHDGGRPARARRDQQLQCSHCPCLAGPPRLRWPGANRRRTSPPLFCAAVRQRGGEFSCLSKCRVHQQRCVLGFHTYDFEPGDASNGFRERRYVLNYSSWISPGLFGPGFEDITALSHEVTESLNDPFVGSDGVHGITPWWLSQNGNCQNDLEVGDVIEGLPDATI